jgi:hypothetical protein
MNKMKEKKIPHCREQFQNTIGEAAFSREGFGRQSMSEKRRAHVDPSHSEVYQKIKHLRDSNRGI